MCGGLLVAEMDLRSRVFPDRLAESHETASLPRPTSFNGECPRFGHGILRLVFLWLALSGCQSKSDYRPLEQSEAMQRLSQWLPTADQSVELLKHGVHTDGRTEYWVFNTPGKPIIPTEPQVEGPSACPESSVFTFAIGVGIPASSLEPPAQDHNQNRKSTTGYQGMLWQWNDNDQSIRLRTAPRNQGFLSILERLDEHQQLK